MTSLLYACTLQTGLRPVAALRRIPMQIVAHFFLLELTVLALLYARYRVAVRA